MTSKGGYPSCCCGLVGGKVSGQESLSCTGGQKERLATRPGGGPWRDQSRLQVEILSGFLWRGTATLVCFSRLNQQKADQERGWLPCEFISTKSPSVVRGQTPAAGTAGAKKRVLGHALCQALSIITYVRRMWKSVRLPTHFRQLCSPSRAFCPPDRCLQLIHSHSSFV